MKKVLVLIMLLGTMILSAQEANSITTKNIEKEKIEGNEAIDQLKKELEIIKSENKLLKTTIGQQKEMHKNCKTEHQNAHDGLVSTDTNNKARRQAIKGSRYRNILPPPL